MKDSLLRYQQYNPGHKKFYDDAEFHFKDHELAPDCSEKSSIHKIEIAMADPGRGLPVIPSAR